MKTLRITLRDFNTTILIADGIFYGSYKRVFEAATGTIKGIEAWRAHPQYERQTFQTVADAEDWLLGFVPKSKN